MKTYNQFTEQTMSPTQFAKINAVAKPAERLALYLGLNCALSTVELGRLVVTDFTLDAAHPLADRLAIDKSPCGWLRVLRPRTCVFGEWYLWPETVEIVRRAIARANHIGTDRIFCRDNGKPIYDDSKANPNTRFANMWARMLRRSGIETRFPFRCLRMSLPNYLLQHHSSELASLCLMHGTPGGNNRIDCYANRPFGQFHRAIQESRAYFAPMFGELD